jgi:hypothetical protein
MVSPKAKTVSIVFRDDQAPRSVEMPLDASERGRMISLHALDL